MARQLLTTTVAAIDTSVPGAAGVLATLVLPISADGARFENAVGRNLLLFINGLNAVSAVTTIITIQSVADPHGREGDIVITVAPGQVAVCGPFPPALFNQPSGTDKGRVYVDYSAIHANARHAVVRV